MNNVDMKELQKEMKELGIINVEADGNFSPEMLRDAIDAVKETKLDFKRLAEQSKKEAAKAR